MLNSYAGLILPLVASATATGSCSGSSSSRSRARLAGSRARRRCRAVRRFFLDVTCRCRGQYRRA
ncbi:MAG: hypothetical protein HPM95_17205 [Alphaproteobacteria bacterium]|nr:hypothetical protein [Alphaproteobacteria bacterium]